LDTDVFRTLPQGGWNVSRYTDEWRARFNDPRTGREYYAQNRPAVAERLRVR
jgi:hypothetical protein